MGSQERNITEEDVMGVVDLFTKVPVVILKMAVFRNMNVVKKFRSQIENYKDQLSDEEIEKIKKVIEMPVPELQELLARAHAEKGHEQLKILADPKAEQFIRDNLSELKVLLFK
ncbi:hypothetical protein [Methanobacterium sp. MBAC-LM]|uniref:hypothetical protein n=1 Tax=Methanobacterium sp. MBAC-LM TaxID=3412034 RepID=UPI003C72B82E